LAVRDREGARASFGRAVEILSPHEATHAAALVEALLERARAQRGLGRHGDAAASHEQAWTVAARRLGRDARARQAAADAHFGERAAIDAAAATAALHREGLARVAWGDAAAAAQVRAAIDPDAVRDGVAETVTSISRHVRACFRAHVEAH